MFDQIRRAKEHWDLGVGSQYTIAYNDAYNAYQSAVRDEEDARRARAEMFVAIASIMSTSVLMAVAAYGPLRRVAMRAALRTLGQQNTRAVLNLVARQGSHPIVAFSLGSAHDLVKNKASQAVKDAAIRLVQNTSAGISAVSPLSRGEEIRQLIGFQGLAIEEWAEALRADRTLTISERETALAALMQSPFMQPPLGRLDAGKLRQRIELGFYMQRILNSDYTVSHGPVGARMPRGPAQPIAALPSDRNYPRNEAATAMSFYTTVEIDRPEFSMQEATDRAHNEVYRRPFYTHGRHLGFFQSPAGKEEELVRAEHILRDLSSRTRPGTAQAIRVV